jgi:hypothetical protein
VNGSAGSKPYRDRLNEVSGDPRAPMVGNRVHDFEQWPVKGVRPTVRTLTILARICGTTWDLLVDAADLAHMPGTDRAAYAEAASGRAHAIGADPPPPAEEIHIWMATADRITRHVTISRQQATAPLLMSVFHELAGEPDTQSRQHLTGETVTRLHHRYPAADVRVPGHEAAQVPDAKRRAHG